MTAGLVAVELPEPPAPDPVTHVVTFEGGVRVMGPLLIIPGRSLDVYSLPEARRHAASVLAACALLEADRVARRG